MCNKNILQKVYSDMVSHGEWYSIGQLKAKYDLTRSQRDYLRQCLFGERLDYTILRKKINGVVLYKLEQKRDSKRPTLQNLALSFAPTSSSTFTLKHGF